MMMMMMMQKRQTSVARQKNDNLTPVLCSSFYCDQCYLLSVSTSQQCVYKCFVQLITWYFPLTASFKLLNLFYYILFTVFDYFSSQGTCGVVLAEDVELAGFVPLLSLSYSPLYVSSDVDLVS